MKIEEALHDTHASLELKGDFETDDAELFLKAVDDLRAKGVTRIAASLRMVKYLNSTALGTMVQARKLLRRESGDFVIVKPSPISREVISKMGLDSVLRMFDDEQAAVRYLAAAGTATGKAGASKGSVEGGVEPAVAVFSFPDDRSDLLGETRRGVGTIESVDSEKIVFAWDPSRHGLGAEQIATVFAFGSPIQTKFQFKLVRKHFFDVAATIDRIANNPDGTVTVSAKWSAISESDESALWQFTKDMAYLRRQVSDEAESQ